MVRIHLAHFCPCRHFIMLGFSVRGFGDEQTRLLTKRVVASDCQSWFTLLSGMGAAWRGAAVHPDGRPHDIPESLSAPHRSPLHREVQGMTFRCRCDMRILLLRTSLTLQQCHTCDQWWTQEYGREGAFPNFPESGKNGFVQEPQQKKPGWVL